MSHSQSPFIATVILKWIFFVPLGLIALFAAQFVVTLSYEWISVRYDTSEILSMILVAGGVLLVPLLALYYAGVGMRRFAPNSQVALYILTSIAILYYLILIAAQFIEKTTNMPLAVFVIVTAVSGTCYCGGLWDDSKD